MVREQAVAPLPSWLLIQHYSLARGVGEYPAQGRPAGVEISWLEYTSSQTIIFPVD